MTLGPERCEWPSMIGPVYEVCAKTVPANPSRVSATSATARIRRSWSNDTVTLKPLQGAVVDPQCAKHVAVVGSQLRPRPADLGWCGRHPRRRRGHADSAELRIRHLDKDTPSGNVRIPRDIRDVVHGRGGEIVLLEQPDHLGQRPGPDR